MTAAVSAFAPASPRLPDVASAVEAGVNDGAVDDEDAAAALVVVGAVVAAAAAECVALGCGWVGTCLFKALVGGVQGLPGSIVHRPFGMVGDSTETTAPRGSEQWISTG